MKVPAIRIEKCNAAPIRPDGQYVLYWMIAARRPHANFALQRAVEWALDLRKPLLIFEPLRIDYRWASDRIHRFVIDGMAHNEQHFAKRPVFYFPYVEPTHDADKGLLAVLAEDACVVVTDEFPSFFLPQMVKAAGSRLPICLEHVDSNGLLPLRATDTVFPTAYAFRRFLQKELRQHLTEFPLPDPLDGVQLSRLKSLPGQIELRWPRAPAALLAGKAGSLESLGIDHAVACVDIEGGFLMARRHLEQFLSVHLPHYAEAANHPDDNHRSGLSPYLHFGHVSAHEAVAEVLRFEGWNIHDLSAKATGSRCGWWGISPSAEGWLDELITWRELGYNMSSKRDDYDQYQSLPEWAQRTLAKHRHDPRPVVYSLDEFYRAQTHDALWNAAQTQLAREGRIHSYLRMLWGKKIFEWSASPEQSLDVMIELNNRLALDGRNPNSYSGIFWILGRYDRAWGPERPIYGSIRYMTSENTSRKLRVKEYLRQYS